MDVFDIESLAARHGDSLGRLCYGLCKNSHDAEDLYQETRLKVLKNAGKYREQARFERYLFRICINTYRDIYNKRKRRGEVYIDSEEKKRYIESIPDRDDRDDYSALYDAIQQLSYKHKTVITLAYLSALVKRLNSCSYTVDKSYLEVKYDCSLTAWGMGCIAAGIDDRGRYIVRINEEHRVVPRDAYADVLSLAAFGFFTNTYGQYIASERLLSFIDCYDSAVHPYMTQQQLAELAKKGAELTFDDLAGYGCAVKFADRISRGGGEAVEYYCIVFPIESAGESFLCVRGPAEGAVESALVFDKNTFALECDMLRPDGADFENGLEPLGAMTFRADSGGGYFDSFYHGIVTDNAHPLP